MQLLLIAVAVLAVAVGVAYWWSTALQEQTEQGQQIVSFPEGLEVKLLCAARCSGLTSSDTAVISTWMKDAGCGTHGGNSDETTCDASPEQICLTACIGAQTDMSKWLPGAFDSKTTAGATRHLPAMKQGLDAHFQCASRCVSEGVTVDLMAEGSNATSKAVDILQRCGVVQLSGAYDHELLAKVRRSIDTLRSQEGRYAALVDHKQLRGGRYQLYLPFTSPFNSAAALGVSDPVLSVLHSYFGTQDFGIDHISVLTSTGGSEEQALHPDVPYFKKLHLSVHTALDDITVDMGPTFFCPCTGEASSDWATNAGIRMHALLTKDCVGASYIRQLTPQGMVTIYDGVTFHKGSANPSSKPRHLLKLELGAGDFALRRDYTKGAPLEAQRQTSRYRKAFGAPRFGRSS